MTKKQRKFADDGWAIWINGEDVSTVYINDWLNPKGMNFIDLAIRIRGVKESKSLNVYVPFFVTLISNFEFTISNFLTLPQKAPCQRHRWDIQSPREDPQTLFRVRYRARVSRAPRHIPSRKGHIHI